MKATHTFTPEEEAAWMANPSWRNTYPSSLNPHRALDLRAVGLKWREVAQLLGLASPQSAQMTAKRHYPESCDYCEKMEQVSA